MRPVGGQRLVNDLEDSADGPTRFLFGGASRAHEPMRVLRIFLTALDASEVETGHGDDCTRPAIHSAEF
jgi:hypothetical protein